MYLLGVLALGFYAFKIPERYFPGTCDKLYGQCINTLQAVVFSRLDVTLKRERNHCEQPFAFPSGTHVHVMLTLIIINNSSITFTFS